MSSPFVSTNITENGFTIVTHVLPVQPPPSRTEAGGIFSRTHARSRGHDLSPGCPVRTTTKKADVLGTVQIMTGVISLSLSIVLTQNDSRFCYSKSAHGFWGSALYIITGVLTMTAKNNLKARLVKGSLAMNAISTVAAGIAIVLLSLDLAYLQILFQSQTSGISAVLLVFSLLMFIVSICMMLFNFDMIFCTEPAGSMCSQFPALGGHCSLSNPLWAPANEEGVFVISNPSVDNPALTRPPEYSEIEPQFQP